MKATIGLRATSVLTVAAMALGACGVEPDAEVESQSSELTSPSALLIVGNTKLNAGDAAVQTRLQALGLTVTVKADAAATTADAAGKQLILISSTVTSGAVNTKFKTVTVPVIVWEASLLDDMGMTANANGVDYGTMANQKQLSIVAPSTDPMAAGLSGKPTVTSAASTFTWGKPSAGAVVVAHLASDAQKSAIFRYDKGVQMVGLKAPARRVGFFLEDITASVLTTAGQALGDAAIRWAVGMTKVNGTACAVSADCISGVCADGVCCATSCTGACKSCAVAGMMGTCQSVAVGQLDPHGVCLQTAASTCGANGRCDGSGGCQLYPAGTICGPSTCTGATFTPGRTCNGGGVCAAAPSSTCAPYTCAASGVCASSCTTNSGCVAPASCIGNTCSGLKPLGQACAVGSSCASGFCVDGVCCGTSTCGTCQACNVVGNGTCANVASGAADPHVRCTPNPPCGNTGNCNGAGACAQASASTPCGTASCAVSTYTPASHCTGSGTCAVPTPSSCLPYVCGAAACKAVCAGDGDCVPPFTCQASSTCGLKMNGLACTTGGQCISGNCVDSVCCGSSCSSCTPTTCAAASKNCGTIPDGCGGTLNCGICTFPNTCGGSGVPNVCSCTPTTCAAQSKHCGGISDGCGGILNCGTCTGPQTCGGGGTPNVCGCTGSCAGKACGADNGCGTPCSAGSCPSGQTCGGGGVANVCGCTGSCAGKACGAGDGCGGQCSAGSCAAGLTCGGGGTQNVCGCTPDCNGAACGAGDGCGGQCSAGSCAPGLTCGGGGTQNACG
jgi:hypothetical protein